MARSKPGLLPRNTDQSPLSPHQCRKKKGKRTPNYANPQDEYILILLEYKLMPWLSDWTFWQEWEVDRTTFTFSTWGASVWHRINSQSLNKLSFGQTQRIIKPHTVQAADSSHKPLKRQATVFIKNNHGGGKKKKKLKPSSCVSDPVWIPTRAPNMQRKWVFCGLVCPLSHWALLSQKHLGNPWSLMYGSQGTGACRSWLGRQWRADAFWKSHTQATLISHTVFEWPLKKDARLFTEASFCSLNEIQGGKKHQCPFSHVATTSGF